MELKEIERVVEQSKSRLFQMSSPPVKYWLLTELMGKEEHDAAVIRVLRECNTYPPKVKLLSKLRPDGTWPIPSHKKALEDAGPGPPIGFTYRTILWNLDTLTDYNTSREDGHVEAALQNILKWQSEDGHIPGPWTDAFPLPYFNGHAARVLLWYGLGRDRRVQKLLSWLLSIQRPDGGWNIPYMEDLHYLPEFRWMRMRDFVNLIRKEDKSKFDLTKLHHIPSCQWSTMMVIRGLAESPKLARSRAVRKGAEFFLNRFFMRNNHSTYYYTENHWKTLTYPIRFGNGLMALDILTKLGYGPDDPRMDKPIAWLAGARSSDGIWGQTMRPHPDRDQWISLMAVRTLSRYTEKR